VSKFPNLNAPDPVRLRAIGLSFLVRIYSFVCLIICVIGTMIKQTDEATHPKVGSSRSSFDKVCDQSG
jgi:hypothetical protein